VLGRLLLLLILVPLVEIAVLVWLGSHTSWLLVLGLLVAAGMLGAWMARQQGWRTVQRIESELNAGTLPADSVLDGLIVFAAAVLLILPGLVSDVLAIALLFPPTRRIFKFWLAWRMGRRIGTSTFGRGAGPRFGQATFPRDEIIDARVVDAPATSGGKPA